MKAILLNLTCDDKMLVPSGVNSKQVDETQSFTISLRESCHSRPDKNLSCELPSPAAKAPIVLKKVKAEVDMEAQADASENTKDDCSDQNPRCDLEREIPRESRSLWGKQSAATLTKANICQVAILERTKVGLDYRNGKVRGELKEISSVSPKKSEKVSKKDASPGGILTEKDVLPTADSSGEPVIRCDIQGHISEASNNVVSRTDTSGWKLPASAEGINKGDSPNEIPKKVTWQETQGSSDGNPSSMKDGNVSASVSSNSLSGHRPDKTLEVRNDVSASATTERPSGQFGFNRPANEIEGNSSEKMAASLAGRLAVTNGVQFSDHYGNVVKEGGGAHGTPVVNMHESSDRNNPGTAGEAGPTLLGATAKAIEVGVASGTHGWLKIRAEIEHGVVTASIATKSVVAQEMLHHELPSLNAFLQEEKVGSGVVAIKQLPSTDPGGMGQGGYKDGREQLMYPQSGKRNEAIPSGGEQDRGNGEQTEILEAHNPRLAALTAGIGGWLNIRV